MKAMSWRWLKRIVGDKVRREKALDFSGCNSRPGTGSLHPSRGRHGSTGNRRNPMVSAEGASLPRVARAVWPETVKHGSVGGLGRNPPGLLSNRWL